jgi:2Fe-2S ferredoxin
MPKLTFLPHPERCPEGMEINVEAGESILNAALRFGIDIEHACEKACACTTCHVIVRQGFDSLEESDEDEDDMLDKAWGLEPESRLSCQALVADEDLVIEIPKYNINMVSEGH